MRGYDWLGHADFLGSARDTLHLGNKAEYLQLVEGSLGREYTLHDGTFRVEQLLSSLNHRQLYMKCLDPYLGIYEIASFKLIPTF